MKTNKEGANSVVVRVLPRDVKQLQDDEIIIVSRAQLNTQYAFMSMNVITDEQKENMQIVKSAIDAMMKREKARKSFAIGAEMTVKDVKRVFATIDKMPQNSFSRIVDNMSYRKFNVNT